MKSCRKLYHKEIFISWTVLPLKADNEMRWLQHDVPPPSIGSLLSRSPTSNQQPTIPKQRTSCSSLWEKKDVESDRCCLLLPLLTLSCSGQRWGHLDGFTVHLPWLCWLLVGKLSVSGQPGEGMNACVQLAGLLCPTKSCISHVKELRKGLCYMLVWWTWGRMQLYSRSILFGIHQHLMLNS